MSIAEINPNIYSNQTDKIPLKRSLSYNDLKRKRMLRSEKSKSKLKIKKSTQINRQTENQETNKSTQRFINQLKGLITDYEGATLKNSTLKNNNSCEENIKYLKSAISHRNLDSARKNEHFEISNTFNLSLKPSCLNSQKDQKREVKQRHKILERINKSVRVDCKKDLCLSEKRPEIYKKESEKAQGRIEDGSIFGLDMSKINEEQNESNIDAKIQIESLLSAMSKKVQLRKDKNSEKLKLSRNSSHKSISRIRVQENNRQKLPRDFFK